MYFPQSQLEVFYNIWYVVLHVYIIGGILYDTYVCVCISVFPKLKKATQILPQTLLIKWRGEDTSQFILWVQYYPDTKAR